VSLFIDTSGFYALLVGSESHHGPVKRAFGQAAERGQRLLTTNYVVLETVALLQHRIGLAPVRDFDAKILAVVEVVIVDADLHRRGIQRLFRLDRRQVSIVDAVSFEIMEAEGITNALALDEDFAAEGFRLVPEAR
jgi:uncharacterized protein